MPQDVLDRAASIRLALFDVDGVLTDGSLFFDDQGRESKAFHVRDGLGFKLLRQSGVEVAVISARQSSIVARRMENLGVVHCVQGVEDKLGAYENLRRKLNLAHEQVSHIGDDLLDLPLLRRVGLAIAVADAHPSILPHVHWKTARPGGAGAAREVCDLIMQAQRTLERVTAEFL
ncbi:MAG TPA: HAD-IIIA family hydrolase [Methylococcus sp.]|nr:HAD-IIIA family hydrolase [Methylococcus sp.]